MKTIPIQIKSPTLESRVRNYLSLLHKFHKLTDKEVEILVELLLRYYDIIKKYPVHDDELIGKLLLDIEIKKRIKTKLNIKDSVFENYMTKFRKQGVLKDRVINKSYIPPLEPFELKIMFP